MERWKGGLRLVPLSADSEAAWLLGAGYSDYRLVRSSGSERISVDVCADADTSPRSRIREMWVWRSLYTNSITSSNPQKSDNVMKFFEWPGVGGGESCERKPMLPKNEASYR